jgi:hypothetical protein
VSSTRLTGGCRGALRWFLAAFVVLALAMVGYGVVALAEGPAEALFPVLFVPAVGFRVVLPMALVAAGLRWLWLRWSPTTLRESTAAAVTAG